ncbi:MAG: hypothetical protein HON04_09880 [Planctomicrobium sp.]|nr:hypothetical protein [Planctomicrobium sp.]
MTTRGAGVIFADELEEGSGWLIRNPLQADLSPKDSWINLEAASDHQGMGRN